MGKVIVIGLGPGDTNLLTLEAYDKILNGNRIYLRTKKHGTIKLFEDKSLEYKSFDYLYEDNDTFEEVYENIVGEIIKASKEYGVINYCVPGNPLVGDNTVLSLLKAEENNEIEVELIQGISFIDRSIFSTKRDPLEGLKVIDGLNFSVENLDINSDILISSIYDKDIASMVKVKLGEVYSDDKKIYIVDNKKTSDNIETISIYELDRLNIYNHATSIYIPKLDKIHRNSYDMNNLLNIMERLRSEEGCKWDIKQTHETLRQYIIEEAYEVVDAIDSGDTDHLCEELGDLLLQVVFHSQIAREEGYFNILDVTTSICDKLIYRHPHVFSNNVANNEREALDTWNDMKDKKRNLTTYTEALKDSIKGLPSLLKSYKVQKRASDIGFDWDDIKGPIDKVKEELEEVLEVYNGENEARIEEELGDLLFSVVNFSRFLNVNPETALNKSVNKFINRFSLMEEESKKRGNDIKDMSLEELDVLWNVVKKSQK